MEKKTKLTDEELENVNGGFSFTLFEMPKFLKPLFRFFNLTKKDSSSSNDSTLKKDGIRGSDDN